MKECQLCKNCFTDDVNTCPNDGMPTFHSISGEPVLEGKYHLECRLGQGGMGVVYKARHAYLKTQHAIKIILPDLVGNDPQLVTRFRQEALAAAAIRHPNVVGVSDYGVVQGTMPFIVMEYVEGEDLHDLLEREGKLPPEKALKLMTAIGLGISAAHKQGIVHRDLKPLNVMILKDAATLREAVKILDFGLAKIKSGELLGSFIQAQTTGLMGSPFYMAPEQWADEEPGATSDVYSLGIMFYQMIAGDVPFKGSSIPAIMKKHISDLPPTFAEAGVFVSPALEKAVRHALVKDRTARTQSVANFIEELTVAVLESESARTDEAPVVQEVAKPTSPLQILTIPPNSSVFIDDKPVGSSGDDGWLQLKNIEIGDHHIRVRSGSFFDFESEFTLDNSPKEIVAHLRKDTLAIPMPRKGTIADIKSAAGGVTQAQGNQTFLQETVHQGMNAETSHPGPVTGAQSVSGRPVKRSFTPLILILSGIFGLFALGLIVVGGAYFSGAIGSGGGTPTPTQESTPAPPEQEEKPEMIEIPGGSFTMGNNKGRLNERPEHSVTIKTFYMDKTEVTNADYNRFIAASGYPAPAHFVNGKPLPGKELYPVSFVTHDDAIAYAKWRSKEDGFEYRIPTEEEWEYAARNGSDDNLYPWGDEWEDDRAVIDRESGNMLAVGSKSGANKWGVQDLIGNVWEWTSSPASLYPGSDGVMKETREKRFMVRGGDSLSATEGELAITATLRADLPGSEANKGIGFRLVRSK